MGDLPLTDEHRMLLQMRDTLYEGNWGDFEEDLRARAEDRPHVFATVPRSREMKAVIERHLSMIGEMRGWESTHQRLLTA